MYMYFKSWYTPLYSFYLKWKNFNILIIKISKIKIGTISRNLSLWKRWFKNYKGQSDLWDYIMPLSCECLNCAQSHLCGCLNEMSVFSGHTFFWSPGSDPELKNSLCSANNQPCVLEQDIKLLQARFSHFFRIRAFDWTISEIISF